MQAHDKFMTAAEVAEVLHCHVRTVQRLISRGEIKATHLGGLVRVRASELDRIGRPAGAVAETGTVAFA